MSNSSSPRSVWSFIIKVIITVATAIGGLIGVQSCVCSLMRTITLIIIHCSATPEGKSLSGGGLPSRSYPSPEIP